jgi:hypothetical protein
LGWCGRWVPTAWWMGPNVKSGTEFGVGDGSTDRQRDGGPSLCAWARREAATSSRQARRVRLSEGASGPKLEPSFARPGLPLSIRQGLSIRQALSLSSITFHMEQYLTVGKFGQLRELRSVAGS